MPDLVVKVLAASLERIRLFVGPCLGHMTESVTLLDHLAAPATGGEVTLVSGGGLPRMRGGVDVFVGKRRPVKAAKRVVLPLRLRLRLWSTLAVRDGLPERCAATRIVFRPDLMLQGIRDHIGINRGVGIIVRESCPS